MVGALRIDCVELVLLSGNDATMHARNNARHNAEYHSDMQDTIANLLTPRHACGTAHVEELLSEQAELFGQLCVEENFKRGVQAHNDLETLKTKQRTKPNKLNQMHANK